MLNFVSGITCAICGRNEDIPSEVIPQANYGSRLYQGERYTLHLCGDCIDSRIGAIWKYIPLEQM